MAVERAAVASCGVKTHRGAGEGLGQALGQQMRQALGQQMIQPRGEMKRWLAATLLVQRHELAGRGVAAPLRSIELNPHCIPARV